MLVGVHLYKTVNVYCGWEWVGAGICMSVGPQGWAHMLYTCVASMGHTSWGKKMGMYISSRMRLTSKRVHIACARVCHSAQTPVLRSQYTCV